MHAVPMMHPPEGCHQIQWTLQQQTDCRGVKMIRGFSETRPIAFADATTWWSGGGGSNNLSGGASVWWSVDSFKPY